MMQNELVNVLKSKGWNVEIFTDWVALRNRSCSNEFRALNRAVYTDGMRMGHKCILLIDKTEYQ
jgi:hypothetical protein